MHQTRKKNKKKNRQGRNRCLNPIILLTSYYSQPHDVGIPPWVDSSLFFSSHIFQVTIIILLRNENLKNTGAIKSELMNNIFIL